jgi:hypothetical protein
MPDRPSKEPLRFDVGGKFGEFVVRHRRALHRKLNASAKKLSPP